MRQEQEDAQPEVTEVAPGILRAQIPIHFTGLGHVNTYLLEDDQGWTAIDPGLPGPATWKALQDRLRQVGARVTDVHTVVVTHSHPDHFGSAERLRREADGTMVAATDFRTFFDAFEPDVVESPPDRTAAGDRAALARVQGRFEARTPWGGEMPRPPMPGSGPAGWLARRAASRWFKAPYPDVRLADGETVRLGVSTRGMLALLHSSQALACVRGRTYVTPDDVQLLAVPVLAHRIIVRGLFAGGDAARAVVHETLAAVPVPTEQPDV